MATLIKIGKVYYSDLRVRGKRIRRALSTDKRFAEEKLADLVKERAAAKHGHPVRDISWDSFKGKYLAERVAQAKSTFTITKRTIQEVEAFLLPQRLSEVKPEAVSRLFVDMKQRKKPLGLYMRNRIAQGIKTMMRRAEEWELVEKKDWGVVKLDREPKGRLLWYSQNELRRLLGACNGVWKTVAMLGARAGLRRSEIYWLEWSDVDFERDRIHIAPKKEWHPKDHERRWIGMSVDLAAYLKALPKDGRFVLDANGERPGLETMSSYFRRIVKSAGLKGNIHTLRHTFGSMLASAGVSIYIIKDLLGHSEVEMTSRYSHLSPDSTAGAVNKLPPL